MNYKNCIRCGNKINTYLGKYTKSNCLECNSDSWVCNTCGRINTMYNKKCSRCKTAVDSDEQFKKIDYIVINLTSGDKYHWFVKQEINKEEEMEKNTTQPTEEENTKSNSKERVFHKGDLVRHFKYETDDIFNLFKYIYEIVDIAYDTNHTYLEDGKEYMESVIVYRQLSHPYATFVRLEKQFKSEVDHEKYPDIKQKYRFEVIRNELVLPKINV